MPFNRKFPPACIKCDSVSVQFPLCIFLGRHLLCEIRHTCLSNFKCQCSKHSWIADAKRNIFSAMVVRLSSLLPERFLIKCYFQYHFTSHFPIVLAGRTFSQILVQEWMIQCDLYLPPLYIIIKTIIQMPWTKFSNLQTSTLHCQFHILRNESRFL